MTAPDPRLGEIEAAEAVEAAARAMLDKMYDDKTLRVDDEDRDIARAALEAAHPILLAELRTVREALARVEAACDRVIKNEDGHKPPGPPHPTQQQATALRIRAAVAAASEG